MIALTQPLPSGNAVGLLLVPSGSEWVLARKTSTPFFGVEDPAATTVARGGDLYVVDDANLVNGLTYFYALFEPTGTDWTHGPIAQVIPTATYADLTQDALSVLRDRLQFGLQTEVSRGALVPASGAIAVLTAPPLFEDTQWPVVTVHLQSEAPLDRALGEMLYPDFEATAYEGWLARAQIMVMGWTLNPDERISLRNSLRRIVVANLPIFESHAMSQIEFQVQDTEDFTSYNSPVYQVMGTFSCTVPVAVSGQYEAVETVNVAALAPSDYFRTDFNVNRG